MYKCESGREYKIFVLYEFACTCKERTFVSFSSGENGGESVSAVWS